MPPDEQTSLLDRLIMEQDPEGGGKAASQPPSLKPSPRRHTVEYDGDSHFAVLFQMYGSVWPRVLPWCLFSLAYTYLIIYLRNHDIIDLTISSNDGHTFMSLLVSFLVVTRTTITYNRFMEARQHLSDLFRSAREVVQHACILTSQNQGAAAVQWRQEMAYKTIVTLRVAIAAGEYRSSGVNIWEVLPDGDHEQTELYLSPRDHAGIEEYKSCPDRADFLRTLVHGPRTKTDENFRAPVVWAYNLRNHILRTRRGGVLEDRPMHVNEELKILGFVSDFLTAYHGVKKLIVTPFPFPLVQMTRTFLFFWVYSLPLVLISDNDQTLEVLVMIFFCTYGFLGLEYVNIELDDPYGNDPNDFPGQRWAELVFEDIYIAIYKTDGYESAAKIRSRITERLAQGNALDNYREDFAQISFWRSLSKLASERRTFSFAEDSPTEDY